MVAGLAAFVAMAGAAETAKKPKKAKKVTISGKLGVPGVAIDEASAISMTVIVKGGEPQKIKNVLVTYSYECSDNPPRTGVAYSSSPSRLTLTFSRARRLTDWTSNGNLRRALPGSSAM